MIPSLRSKIIRYGAKELLFGGGGNRVALNDHKVVGPRLTETELSIFEARHRIRLPEEYRTFLTEVGNGSLGPPEYGLYPLDETVHATSRPDLPFPLSDGWNWDAEEDEEPLTEERDALRRACWREGALILGDDGCGMHPLLITTGPLRGQIWDAADVGMFPHHPPRTFLPWFTEWLDEALAKSA